jgi:hypothetical protein
MVEISIRVFVSYSWMVCGGGKVRQGQEGVLDRTECSLSYRCGRWRGRQTTLFDLPLILSPAGLQRYNRIHAYRAICLLARRENHR